LDPRVFFLESLLSIRLGELSVYKFEPRENHHHKIQQKMQIKAKPVSGEDCNMLKGFVEHLAGITPNDLSRRGREKVAVVRWGPIEFFLTLRDPQDPKPSHGLILHI
jgi:hypothetical protein